MTLFELLIAVALFSIIMSGFYHLLSTALSTYEYSGDNRELLAQARYAMERIVMFGQEAREIKEPAADKLEFPERVLDTHDNATHAYRVDGDGILDADRDAYLQEVDARLEESRKAAEQRRLEADERFKARRLQRSNRAKADTCA